LNDITDLKLGKLLQPKQDDSQTKKSKKKKKKKKKSKIKDLKMPDFEKEFLRYPDDEDLDKPKKIRMPIQITGNN
jgi:hypothetical protein